MVRTTEVIGEVGPTSRTSVGGHAFSKNPAKICGRVNVGDHGQLDGSNPVGVRSQQVAQALVARDLVHQVEVAALEEDRGRRMSAAERRNDWAFSTSSEDGLDAAERQGWLVTQQDDGRLDGRRQGGESKLQRSAQAQLWMRIGHPQDLRDRRGTNQPAGDDRHNRVQDSLDGERQHVLQDRPLAEHGQLLGRPKSA